eukprot:scaffold1912_cov167-Amphora_coffeaeformis.AAC.26
METEKFQLLRALPPEIAHNILTAFTSGKDLSTLSLALAGSSKHQELFSVVIEIGEERIRAVAGYIESKSAESNKGRVDIFVAKAVAWIHSVVDGSPTAEVDTKKSLRYLIRHHSENMALLDFLQASLVRYCRPDQGEFEWPVWVGQICVEAFVQGTRLRSTARVVLTTPLQRPGYIPGSGLLKNQTPSTVFRCELYNMIPVPPWGCLRPLSKDDEQVLQSVAGRLDTHEHVAVPSGFYHTTDILDVRIITSRQAERLLASRSWRPRTDWIVRGQSSASSSNIGDSPPMHLMCCWQDDSAELVDDRDYLSYIIDMLKTQKRLALSTNASNQNT